MANILFVKDDSLYKNWPAWLVKTLGILALLSIAFLLVVVVKTVMLEPETQTVASPSAENQGTPPVVTDTSGEGSILPYVYGRSWKKLDGLWYPVDTGDEVLLDRSVFPGVAVPGSKFENGVAAIKVDGKWGLVDLVHKLYVPPTYDYPLEISEFDGVLYRLHCGGRMGLIDNQARLILPVEYDYFREFTNDWICYGKHDLYGLVDGQGNVITEPIYDDFRLDNDTIVAVKGGLYGCLDLTGRVIVPFSYEYLDILYYDNTIPDWLGEWQYEVRQDGLYGVIDEQNRYVIQPQFSSFEVYRLEDGLIKVSVMDEDRIQLYGVIDINGDYVIQPVYNYLAYNWHNKYYYAIYQGQKGYLDVNYTFVTEMAGDTYWQDICSWGYGFP